MHNAYFTILRCNFQINFLQVRKCPFVWKYCKRTLRVLVKVVHLTFFLMILLNGSKVIKFSFKVVIQLVYFSVSSSKLVVQILDDSQVFYREILRTRCFWNIYWKVHKSNKNFKEKVWNFSPIRVLMGIQILNFSEFFSSYRVNLV